MGTLNRKTGMCASAVNAFTVLCFALFMMAGFTFGSYFVCIFLSLSFVCMTASFECECADDRKAAGKTGLVLSGIYSTLIMIVYFTQCTTVLNESLGGDAQRILDFRYMGLIFNMDLLGYGIMALSTFFTGLTVNVRNKKDKALKTLLLLHGLFFPGCFLMPMTGMFTGSVSASAGGTSAGGVIALEFWCLFFLPIGILSFLHFKDRDSSKQG
ncbi:MAG: hypothetical protein II936_09485 [Oscillospiraceae bacterium]|nr:hypothetical protein [Oscillospiraceae bacterium]